VIGTAQPARAAPAPVSTASAAARRPTRVLCDRKPAADGKPLPEGDLLRLEEGGAHLPEAIPTGGGAWTWVNLWAGYCAPCKEEMPMLVAWEKKLRAAGTPLRVAFLSIDDDERQARRFLAAQPHVKSSWRLAEGEGRTEWLAAVGVSDSPALPVHLLFDPEGALRCVVTGAIGEADYARVAQIVARR
jgi:thiol-disulfide isomerase/thioredoxin